MGQKRTKSGINGTLLNYLSIKPKISRTDDSPNSQALFVSPSTSDNIGNYENVSSYDISLFVTWRAA